MKQMDMNSLQISKSEARIKVLVGHRNHLKDKTEN